MAGRLMPLLLPSVSTPFIADRAAVSGLTVRALLLRDTDVRAFFEARLARLRRSILTGDEIGSGVVPMDPFERRWRDETGFLYQYLAREAETVERVWAGLAVKIKG